MAHGKNAQKAGKASKTVTKQMTKLEKKVQVAEDRLLEQTIKAAAKERKAKEQKALEEYQKAVKEKAPQKEVDKLQKNTRLKLKPPTTKATSREKKLNEAQLLALTEERIMAIEAAQKQREIFNDEVPLAAYGMTPFDLNEAQKSNVKTEKTSPPDSLLSFSGLLDAFDANRSKQMTTISASPKLKLNTTPDLNFVPNVPSSSPFEQFLASTLSKPERNKDSVGQNIPTPEQPTSLGASTHLPKIDIKTYFNSPLDNPWLSDTDTSNSLDVQDITSTQSESEPLVDTTEQQPTKLEEPMPIDVSSKSPKLDQPIEEVVEEPQEEDHEYESDNDLVPDVVDDAEETGHLDDVEMTDTDTIEEQAEESSEAVKVLADTVLSRNVEGFDIDRPTEGSVREPQETIQGHIEDNSEAEIPDTNLTGQAEIHFDTNSPGKELVEEAEATQEQAMEAQESIEAANVEVSEIESHITGLVLEQPQGMIEAQKQTAKVDIDLTVNVQVPSDLKNFLRWDHPAFLVLIALGIFALLALWTAGVIPILGVFYLLSQQSQEDGCAPTSAATLIPEDLSPLHRREQLTFTEYNRWIECYLKAQLFDRQEEQLVGSSTRSSLRSSTNEIILGMGLADTIVNARMSRTSSAALESSGSSSPPPIHDRSLDTNHIHTRMPSANISTGQGSGDSKCSAFLAPVDDLMTVFLHEC